MYVPEVLQKIWHTDPYISMCNGVHQVDFESLLRALTLRKGDYIRGMITESLESQESQTVADILNQALQTEELCYSRIMLPDVLALRLVALMPTQSLSWMTRVNATVRLGSCSFNITEGLTHPASCPIVNVEVTQSGLAPTKELSLVPSGTRASNLELNNCRVSKMPESLDEILELARQEKLPPGNLLFKDEDMADTGRAPVPHFDRTEPSRVSELEYDDEEGAEPVLHIDDWMSTRQFMGSVAQITSCSALTRKLVPSLVCRALLATPSTIDDKKPAICVEPAEDEIEEIE